MPTSVEKRKAAARAQMWNRLDDARAVIGGSSHGKIPNFVGATRAADRLTTLDAWQQARVIKAVPDKAQLPARIAALEAAKTVYMAVPKLASKHPFNRLDTRNDTVPAAELANSNTSAAHAIPVTVDEIEPVDLIICGSVAVDRRGARLGKGAGYSDIEVALLAEAGLIGPNTTITTTVHQLQVVDDELPEADHDFRVDLIVTPDEVITCGPQRRPSGLTWSNLTDAKIAAIPVLAARANSR